MIKPNPHDAILDRALREVDARRRRRRALQFTPVAALLVLITLPFWPAAPTPSPAPTPAPHAIAQQTPSTPPPTTTANLDTQHDAQPETRPTTSPTPVPIRLVMRTVRAPSPSSLQPTPPAPIATTRLTDSQLIELLRESDHPAGLVRTANSLRLTPHAHANSAPDAPPNGPPIGPSGRRDPGATLPSWSQPSSS